MPIIKSAQKRVRTARKASVRNLKTKRNLKSAIKTLAGALSSGKKTVGDEFSEAVSAIDKAVKKGVIHKNKAARQKSRLSAQAKKAGAKTTGGSSKKPATKKTTAKKTAAKKPATKKPVAKAKKAPAKKKTAKK